MISNVLDFGFWVLGVIAALFAVLFLGGLASAALEIRAEKKAGYMPTRPAWDKRDARIAAGGYRASIRGYWKGIKS